MACSTLVLPDSRSLLRWRGFQFSMRALWIRILLLAARVIALGEMFWAGTTGIRNGRFQPYRLERNRSWGKGDARLQCIACHNPHEQIVRDAASYDTKCLAGHVARGIQTSRDRPGKACPVGVKACVTCHMPPAEIASMHAPFTDHRIRIAREGEPFLPDRS